jgi:NodT family efflux transporter outer membrane factor (OMF) lipoprotein
MLSRRLEAPRQVDRNLMLVKLGATLAVALALAGCMVGPNYERPSADVNDAWQAVEGPQAASTASDWWASFEDPTLTRLIEEAHAQNLSLKVAGLRVIEARAARGIAVGDFFPQTQNAFGSIAAEQLSENEAAASGDRAFSSDVVGLEAAWELDFWGKFRRGIEAADAEVLLAVADFDSVFVTLTAEVATNYILVRSLQERLVFARANVDLQAETLGLTETRFRAGAVSELDVATARATLANTRALIPELELALRQATLALGVLLGRTPSALEAELATADNAAPRVPEAPAQ